MGGIKLMTKQTEEEFVNMVIGFARKNKMTISNIKEGMCLVAKYLEDNASLDTGEGKDIGKNQKSGQKGGYQKDVFPEVEIEACGCTTRVYINGKEVEGIAGVIFSHDKNAGHGLPSLKLELLPSKLEINSCAVLELPDIFRGSYISAHRLHELGILTYSQQMEMVRKGIL